MSEDSPTVTRTCPFADCDWSHEYYPSNYSSDFEAGLEAEMHYEAEHAGTVRVKVTLECDQLLGARDVSEVSDSAHTRWERILEEEFQAWDLAYVGAEVVEEPDDHGKVEMETQDD